MTEVEKRRQEKGFTQAYMARNIGVSIGCYNMYENSQRRIPKSKAEKIADVLRCEVNDLFIPSCFTNCETGTDALE